MEDNSGARFYAKVNHNGLHDASTKQTVKEENGNIPAAGNVSPAKQLASETRRAQVFSPSDAAFPAQSTGPSTSMPTTGPVSDESGQEGLTQSSISPPPRERSPKYATFPRSTTSPMIPTITSPAPARPSQFPSSSSSKLSKAKNLLHPVNLLMRRRTTHGLDIMADDSLGKENSFAVPALSLPANYDPRIRGKGVHDFNAPRPRRNLSSNDAQGFGTPHTNPEARTDSSLFPSLAGLKEEGTKAAPSVNEPGPEKEHVPVFVEMFEHAPAGDDNALAVRRENLENASFLARMTKQLNFDSLATSPQERRALADLSPNLDKQVETHNIAPRSNSTRNASPIHPNAPLLRTSQTETAQQTPPRTEQEFQKLLGLPPNLGSDASRGSRFSFQFNSDHSDAQEKSLESKHKQPFSEQRPQEMKGDGVSDISDDDDSDLHFDENEVEYEEQIPGINADDPEYHLASESTVPPLPNRGNPYQASRAFFEAQSNGQSSQPQKASAVKPAKVPNSGGTTSPTRGNTEQSHGSDEMYFDDGLIEEPTQLEKQNFDESLFDSPIENDHTDPQTRVVAQLEHNNASTVAYDATHAFIRQGLGGAEEFPPSGRVQQEHSSGIDAYHNALASAAAKAAAEGRFRSQSSSISSPVSPAKKEPQDLSYDDYPYYSGTGLDDEYGLDDSALDDDPMIAAANAEALAADTTGFYGTEFQFYGSERNGGEAANGGYFIPPEAFRGGMNGNASREPDLTPITERSEFSARNSFISMGTYNPGLSFPTSLKDGSPLPSPGLKELAARFGKDDDDLTLSQLLKLRKEAFGGSSGPNPFSSSPLASPLLPKRSFGFHSRNASVEEEPSLGSSPTRADHLNGAINSPLFSRSTVAGTSLIMPSVQPGKSFSSGVKLTTSSATNVAPSTSPASHAQSSLPKGSGLPSLSNDTSVPLPPSSLMQKFATRPPASSAAFLPQPPSPVRTPGGIIRTQPQQTGRNPAGHGADSVAYVKEEVETGSGSDEASDSGYSDAETRDRGSMERGKKRRVKEVRWYLERRRTTETGEVVVVGRELVEGGRI